MNDELKDKEYRQFVQKVIDNIKKNGFPEKKVAFGLEQMYEAAYNKGINFNKVLDTLDSIQIAHQKTPEKVIFFPKDQQVQDEPAAGRIPGMPPGIDPAMFKDFDFSKLNLNPESFKGMNPLQMMKKAAEMVRKMDPEQLSAVKDMYTNMTPEQRKKMMEQAKKFGFDPTGKKD
jgi:hypothetical protein